MKPVCLHSSRRGMGLVEVAVAVGIMALMFSAIAFLVIMAGRNTVLVSEQALSQNQASNAMERITNTLRNAEVIYALAGDDIATSLTRIGFDIPDTGQSGVIAYVPSSGDTPGATSDGIIKIFMDSSDYDAGTLATDKADFEYRGIQDFKIGYRTSTWITLQISFSYRSYLNFSGHNNDTDKRMAGEYITDVIAKNHHPGESGAYGHTTTSVFLL